jgi:hypothetical protein
MSTGLTLKSFEFFILLLTVSFLAGCEKGKDTTDFSGIYCLNVQNMEMNIKQTGNEVSFSLQSDLLTDGTGTISGDTLFLTAITNESGTFISNLVFSEDRKSFSGSFEVLDDVGNKTLEGVLQGDKGECAKYDIDLKGIPKFVEEDFTDLTKIMEISKFRSGIGHSYTDDFEACRSMKHYYTPFEIYRDNNIVEIRSPVLGTVISVSNDGHGASTGLKNKQIHIRPDNQPAFTLVIFHCDLISSAITMSKKVQAGELLGYGRLYYDDLDEYASSFDIAIWVNTPAGMRLVSYFETMKDEVFNYYIARGAVSRQDFIITKEARDADPLECNGETFLTSGNIENGFILQFD